MLIKNRPIIRQQFPQELQPGRHHAEPFVMAGQIILSDFLAQPFLDHRTIHIVVIHPALIPRVIRRVYVDALHLSGVLRKQCLQRKEVVPFNNQVAVRLFRMEVQFSTSSNVW